MNPNLKLSSSYFNYDIINKIESFEEFPKTKPLIISNKKGEIIYLSKSILEKYSLKPGTNLFELDTEPSLETLFNNLLKNNIHTFNLDLIWKLDDGIFESYLVQIEHIIFKDEDTFILYIDSQDNKKKILKKINTYNFALESVDVGVLIADEIANIKYLSGTFEKMVNTHLEKVYNKNIIELFEQFLSEIELDELRIAIEDHKNWVKVISQVTNSGNVQYKEFRLNFIKESIDESNNYIITANDISEHIKKTRLLRRSEQKQKSIINNISDPILIVKRENQRFLFDNANNSFFDNICEMEYLSKDHEISEVVPKTLYEQIQAAIADLEARHRLHTQFYYDLEKNERKYLTKVNYTDDHYDNTRLYIINMTDITEQFEVEKKLREAYKKETSLNKLKSNFLANMSHEIRTPLNAIVGYSDLLEDDVKQMNYESSAQMTTFLKEGVNRLLKLVDNIVEVSILDSGNEELKITPTNINDVINSQKDVWIQQCNLRNIGHAFILDQKNLNANIDCEKLSKALNELVDNAVKYNSENGKIVVTTFEKDEEIFIKIDDTGIGIENEKLEEIFKVFSQAEDDTYTRKYEGAGLGLSLANKLITFMEGKLNISSKPKTGTEVLISFPKA